MKFQEVNNMELVEVSVMGDSSMGDAKMEIGYEKPKTKKVVVDGYEIPSSVAKVEFKPYGAPKFSLDVNVKDVKVTDEGVFATTRYQADNIEKLLRMGGKAGQLTPEGEKIKALEADMRSMRAERDALLESAKKEYEKRMYEKATSPKEMRPTAESLGVMGRGSVRSIGRVLTHEEEEGAMKDELDELRKQLPEKGV